MPGPQANPNKRYSRYARGRQQIVLPVEGRTGPPPKLPAGRAWSKDERALWRELWSSQQATVWLASQASAVALYVTYACAVLAGEAAAWQAAEARHLADKLGLTSAGMASLNWALPDEDAERERDARGRRAAGAYDHLRGGEALKSAAGRSARERLRVINADPREVLRGA